MNTEQAFYQGKSCLVTGVTGGNGGAVARALLRAGARVLGVGRNTDKLRRFRQAADKAGFAGRYELVRGDLASELDRRRIVDAARTFGHGSLDGIFHLAGRALIGVNRTPEEVAAFEESDYHGPKDLVERLLPHLADSAVVVVNTSAAGRVQGRTFPHYCRVKRMVEEWCANLGSDERIAVRGISVTLILMGIIASDIWDVPEHGIRPWMSLGIRRLMPTPDSCAPDILLHASERRPVSHVGRMSRVIGTAPGPLLRVMQEVVDAAIAMGVNY